MGEIPEARRGRAGSARDGFAVHPAVRPELAGVKAPAIAGRIVEVDSPEVWDKLLTSRPRPSFLQSWQWGELKQRFGWEPIRLAIAGAGCEFSGGLQLLVKTWRPARLLPRLALAYVPRGPFGEAAEDQIRDLLGAAVDRARMRGAVFVRIEPPIEDYAHVAGSIAALGFRQTAQFVQLKTTAYVDLAPAAEAILARFKPKTRYNVRLGAKRGLEVRVAENASDLDSFHRLTVLTGARDGFAVHGPEYYRAVWECFGAGAGRLFIARHGEEDVAALFAVRCGEMATYLYGASSDAHRNLMPNHLLQWEAMLWAKGAGCTTYDFWGMADPEVKADSMAGVHRFKAGFNPGLVVHPGALDLPLNTPAYLALARIVLPARALIQGLASGRRRPAPSV